MFPIDVQGQEFDQVIIDVSIEGDYYDKARNIYTLLTRAKEATLAKIDNSVEIKNNLRGNSRTSSISLEIINKSIEDTIKRLNELDLKESNTVSKKEESEEEEEVEKVEEEDELNKIPENIRAVPVTKKTAKELFREDSKEVSQIINGQTDGSEEAKEELTNKALSKDNILAYSFFNNLGILSEGASQKNELEEYLEFTISNEDVISNKQIT